VITTAPSLLLPEEIGFKAKNFSPPSRQERQGKTDALVF
jgi:hypothetical protein